MSELSRRDEIARIVNPGAFRQWQSLYDYCIKTGDSEAEARDTADWAHGTDVAEANFRADAILFLFSERE